MPFWRFYTVQTSSDQFAVVCPPNLILIGIVTLIIGVPLLRWTIAHVREQRMTLSAGLMYLAIYLFFLGFAVSHGTLTLDRRTNTATIRKVHFLYVPTTRTISLDDIQFAKAESAPHSDHFVVVTRDGTSYDLVYWTRMPGQGRAANAVNAFLNSSEARDGTSSPPWISPR